MRQPIRQRLLAPLGHGGLEARGRIPGLPILGIALVAIGCASPSLVPGPQAASIKERDRALARHADAIHSTIAQSGSMGALVFLDANDGRLVVLPGDSPADAWARHSAAPESDNSLISAPPVLTFVHRADVPEPPETVTRRALQQHEELRALVAALDHDRREAYRRIEERLDAVQREVADSVARTRQETDTALTASRAEVQKALNSFSDDLTTVRQFLLQTAQLSSLNHEMNVENAGGIRKVSTASQELSASAARLQEAIRQLSESLAQQLKELGSRLEAIHAKIGALK